MMCGGMGGMGGTGFGQGQSFGQLLAALLSFLGQLASQVLVILTSDPVLRLLIALVLLLVVAGLVRVLLGRRRRAR